jgi:hypothetical protein
VNQSQPKTAMGKGVVLMKGTSIIAVGLLYSLVEDRAFMDVAGETAVVRGRTDTVVNSIARPRASWRDRGSSVSSEGFFGKRFARGVRVSKMSRPHISCKIRVLQTYVSLQTVGPCQDLRAKKE